MITTNFFKKFRKFSFVPTGIFAIVLVTLVAVYPKTSFADPDGTADNPYLITTCEELQAIGNNVAPGVYYQLNGGKGVINCSGTTTWNDNGEGGFYGFSPLENFSGTLDGNSNTITGLYINRPGEDGVGLFSDTNNGAYIHDFTLTDVNMSGAYNIGALAGYLQYDSTVENVSASGTVHGVNYYIGGLVGEVYGDAASSAVSITGGSVSVNVTNDGWATGGLIGYVNMSNNASLTVDDVVVTGDVASGSNDVGGLIGYVYLDSSAKATLSDTSWGDGEATINGQGELGGAVGYADIESGGSVLTLTNVDTNVLIDEGGIIPGYDIGGLVGEVEQYRGGSLVINGGSHATVDIGNGDNIYDVGGIIGYVNNDDYWESSAGSVYIDDTSADGTIDSAWSDIGGFVGYWDARDSLLSITNSTSNLHLTGDSDVGGLIGGYEMYYDSSLTISDTIVGGVDGAVHGNYDVGGLVGYGDAYHGATLTVSNTSVNYGTEGQLSVDDGQNNLGGMFGRLEQRFGSNVTISDSDANVNISATNSGYIGGLIGYSIIRYNSVITVDNSYVDGSIGSTSSGNDIYSLGGFIGQVDSRNSSISIEGESYNNASVTATDNEGTTWNYYIGGFIGHAYSEDIPFTINFDDATNQGAVTTGNGEGVGGFIGEYDGDDNNSGAITITDSTNSANVITNTSESYGIGGFLGEIYDADITIENSTSTEDVTGNEEVGGLIGYANVENGDELTITDSSWTNESGNVVTAPEGYAGGLIGEIELNDQATAVIDGSSATGTISSTTEDGEYIGGLIGEFYTGGDTGETNTLTVTDSYSDVPIEIGSSSIGGLIGYSINSGGHQVINITNSNAVGDIGASDELGSIDEGYAGGLLGSVESGWWWGENPTTVNIDQSYATNDVSSIYEYLGGLVGWTSDLVTVNITDSHATGNITSQIDNDYYGFGGLIGGADDDTTITTSYATGDVTGGQDTGGLIGDSEGVLTIDNSYASGDVSGTRSVGGLVGFADETIIDHSYASGDVTGDLTGLLMWDEDLETDVQETESEVGGLVGETEGGTISNSFSAGAVEEVSGFGIFTAGFLGENDDGATLSNNYYDIDRSGQDHCSIFTDWIDPPVANDTAGECEGVNAPVALGANYFFGDVTANHPFDNGSWNFDTIWKTNVGDYPTLVQTHHITATTGGNGTVTPSGVVSVAEGDDQSFTVAPSEGYAIDDVTVDDVSVGAVTTYEFTDVTGNHSIHATFVSTGPEQFTLTTNTSGNGTGTIHVDPEGPDYDDGTEVTLYAVAAAKSTFKNWSGCSSSTNATITITMDDDKTCTATFNKSSSGTSISGGGGGGSSRPKVTPPATPATPPTDCAAGFLFSPSTGQSCAGVTPPSGNSNAGASSNGHPYTGVLKYKSTGPDVMFLQQSLNKLGFIVSTTGGGSPGNENAYFGLQTEAAVKAFQAAKGLAPVDGVVGPVTWAAILQALGL